MVCAAANAFLLFALVNHAVTLTRDFTEPLAHCTNQDSLLQPSLL